MTRRNILNKYGFTYMSRLELDVELSKDEAIEFEEFIKALNDDFENDKERQNEQINRCR